MALPTTSTSGMFILFVESITPGTFVRECALRSYGLTFSNDIAEDQIPDCDNGDLPATTQMETIATKWSFTGEGVYNKGGGQPRLEALAAAGTPVNIRLRHVGAGSGGATPDLQYAGVAYISEFGLAVEKGSKMTRSITLTGPSLTVTSVAAI